MVPEKITFHAYKVFSLSLALLHAHVSSKQFGLTYILKNLGLEIKSEKALASKSVLQLVVLGKPVLN